MQRRGHAGSLSAANNARNPQAYGLLGSSPDCGRNTCRSAHCRAKTLRTLLVDKKVASAFERKARTHNEKLSSLESDENKKLITKGERPTVGRLARLLGVSSVKVEAEEVGITVRQALVSLAGRRFVGGLRAAQRLGKRVWA